MKMPLVPGQETPGAALTVCDSCFVDYGGHELTLTLHCLDAADEPFLLTLSESDVLAIVDHLNHAKDHLLWQSHPKEAMVSFTQRVSSGDEVAFPGMGTSASAS